VQAPLSLDSRNALIKKENVSREQISIIVIVTGYREG